MPMGRGQLVFACVVFFSIFLAGCNIVGTLEKTGCKMLPAGDMKDHCWQDAAVRLSMPSICYFIKGYKFGVVDNSPPMTKCFLRIAEKEKDPFICGKIVEGHPNGYTKDDCYMATAVAAKNYAFCDFIQNNESRGFGMFIISRDECYKQVGERPVYCAGEKEQVNCLSAKAIDLLDVSICADAEKKADQQLCLMNAIEGIQKKLMADDKAGWSSDQCKRFNDPTLKYTCSILAVAAFRQNEACGNILETQYNEMCKLLIQSQKELSSDYKEADKEKAIAECDKFTIDTFKGACLVSFGQELALTASNEADKALRDPLQMDAIEFYARGCNLIINKDTPPEAGFICIMLPSNVMAPEYCAKYKDEDVKDFCFELDAMDTGDCSKITDAENKKDCGNVAVVYYNAMRKRCGKLQGKEYETCQENFKTGFFMTGLGVRMPETMQKFMSGK
jgi:hypothetical protein